MKTILVLLCIFFASGSGYQDSDIASARIESCRGCSLNRLPEVKQFVMSDAPLYSRLEVRFISGAPPELVLLDAADAELERLPLSSLTRQQCNQLLHDKGFLKNSKNSEF